MTSSFEEEYLVAFHNRRPGVTTKAFDHLPAISNNQTFSSSYACLADAVLRSHKPLSLLELGCGDGCLLQYLEGRNINLIGVDLSRAELHAAQARLGSNASFYLCRAQSLPLKPETIDVVLSHMALMLMDDIGAVVIESKRVLKSGGVFCAIIGRRFLLGPVHDIWIPLLTAAMNEEGLPPLRFGGAVLRQPKALEQLFDDGFTSVECVDVDVPFKATPQDLWVSLAATYNIDRLSESRRDSLGKCFCHMINPLVQIDGTIHTGWGLQKITTQKV